MRAHDPRGPGDEGVEIRPLPGLHQPEMARGRLQRRVARDGAEDAEPRRLHRRAGDAGVAGRADAVQDGAGDGQVRAQRRRPGQRQRRALRLFRGVHHHHHRRPERSGEIGGGAGPVRRPVQQPHRALDQQQVAPLPRRPRAQRAGRHRPGVEIDRGRAQRRLVKARVDIVRPALRPAHRHAAIPQGPHQAQRHRGLARAGGGRGDQQRIRHPRLLDRAAPAREGE